MPPTKQHAWNTDMKRLTLRIPTEQIDWLREYAAREGVSLNVAAAHAIEALLVSSSIRDMKTGRVATTHIHNGDPS